MVVFLFNLLKDTRFAHLLIPTAHSHIRNNSNLTMLALTLSFVLQTMKKLYHTRRQKAIGKYEQLRRDEWRNEYPIVLVHGFGGYMPDESGFFGDYFGYASYGDVQGDNLVFEADVSPWASVHDRACELYQ